ncbi:hypothetical protein E7Z59_14925 [Robertkochia marina]|uniref:Uncharacterized protein n=1 Tax=Robertkochia marina TaxID=1227945 RepID=A0A4V3UXW0_9FLAO|nr:hypothetical protein [Robertkochia marina]THD65870.1 hypothetical protein E7Z59_14925 [Robertkochia marina]
MNKFDPVKNEIVYRVDFNPIPVGEHLNPYYIREFSHLINFVINKLRSSQGELLNYLRSPDWQSLELVSSAIPLDSETLKMMVVLESIFENERQLITPEFSSRLDSIFAWPTLEVAKRFKEEYIPKGVIHRCIVESGSAIEMCGDLLPPGIDLSNLNKEIFSEQLKQTTGRARTYWKQLNNPILPELLIKGRVLVESVIN